MFHYYSDGGASARPQKNENYEEWAEMWFAALANVSAADLRFKKTLQQSSELVPLKHEFGVTGGSSASDPRATATSVRTGGRAASGTTLEPQILALTEH
jgi:hypothetical protein